MVQFRSEVLRLEREKMAQVRVILRHIEEFAEQPGIRALARQGLTVLDKPVK